MTKIFHVLSWPIHAFIRWQIRDMLDIQTEQEIAEAEGEPGRYQW